MYTYRMKSVIGASLSEPRINGTAIGQLYLIHHGTCMCVNCTIVLVIATDNHCHMCVLPSVRTLHMRKSVPYALFTLPLAPHKLPTCT